LAAMDRATSPAIDEADRHAIEAEAATLLEEAQGAFASRLASLDAAPADPLDIPAEAARALAQARRDLAAHVGEVAAHTARRERIATRLADVQARREGLLKRRIEGDEQPGDAGALALFEADDAGIRQLLAQHEAGAPVDRSHLPEAEGRWRTACLEAQGAALGHLAKAAEARTIRLATALVDLNREAGRAGSIGHRLRVDPRWREAAMRGIW